MLCKLLSYSSCLACNTSCNSVPVPVPLPPLSLDQEFLLQGSFWSYQMIKRLWDRNYPEKSSLSSKNIYWRIANFYEVVFSYTVLKICFSARHTQLSWKNVDAVNPALCPLSLSYFWTKHLAELCQEIMWALPSELMPSEGWKRPWISGNSLLMPAAKYAVSSPKLFPGEENNALISPLVLCWDLQRAVHLGITSSPSQSISSCKKLW